MSKRIAKPKKPTKAEIAKETCHYKRVSSNRMECQHKHRIIECWSGRFEEIRPQLIERGMLEQ